MPRTSQYNITAGTTNTLGVQGAGIAASAETTWTAGANAYTMGAGTALTAPRTIAALRNSSGNNDTLALGAFNLETFGLLKGGGNTLTVSSTSGVLRQPGTAPASLYLTIGSVSGGIAIDAPIQDNTGALTLVKSGNGLLTLSGANSFSGGVLLNAGMLTLRSANALGTGAMAMAANTTLTYAADADAQLLIGGTFSITGGTGTVVGAAVGSTTTSATINVAGNATVNAGPVKVNVYGVNRAAAAAGINSYTLIHGDTGSTLNAATYSLGMVYNNTDFTLGTLSATATDLTIPVTSQTPLATAYWKGGLLGATQVWAASNGSTQSNWVATSGGANQALAPGAGTDVIFSNSTVTTSPNLTTLGADMTVRSLTQQSSSRSVALQADGFTLTISPSDPTTGIAIKIGATFVSLGANVILGASQTWSNNGSAVLGVSGSVFNGTNLLTIGGTGDSSISGTIGNGPGGLTKTGRGTLTLSGANTYTGATEINGGTLTLSGAAGALNASMVVTVSNNATLTLSNTSTQGTVNRLRDSMNLTSYGGSVNFNNSSGSGLIHTETTGPVSLTQGQLNVSLSTDMTGGAGNSQTLILGGLTRPGAANTATANFAAPVLNTTTNRIQVTGASQTPAGQTIGPWATVSVGSVVQTDYAVYDPSGYILPARIAPSAEGTWTNPANIYAMAADATLTATRTITALVDASTSGQSWLNLGNFNFESYGILAGSNPSGSVLSISSTGGAVRQPGTNPANFYVSTGIGGLSISAPIQDHGGALTLVKSGNDTSIRDHGLTLSGANTFSGGLVLNVGKLTLSSATALGTGPFTIYGGATIRSELADLSLANNNPVIINGDFAFGSLTSSGSSLNLGTGAVSLGTAPGASRNVSFYSGTLTLGGVISNGTTATSLILDDMGGPYTGTLIVSGSNIYTGGTTVSAGTLIARNPSALGTGSVTVASGQALHYLAVADSPLALGGRLNLSGGTSTNTGTGTTIGGSLGSTASSAAINVAGIASAMAATTGANPAAIKVNVYTINGFAPLPGTNAYTLIHGAPGSSLNGAIYSINQVYNNTNFTVGSPTATATDLTIPVTSATPLSIAYWKGGLSGLESTWAVSSGGVSSWASSLGGPAQALVPGANADVVVGGSGFGSFSAELGGSMNVRSLTCDSGSDVNLRADNTSSQLAIGSGGITKNNFSGPTFIAPDVLLASSQTWTNNSSSGSINTGKVNNGGNLLTIAANSFTNSVNIYGAIIGSGGLTKSGNGNLTLGGLNTYTGPTIINSGKLMIWGSPGVLGPDPTGQPWFDFPGEYPVGSIMQSSGIVLNGGGLDIINKTTDTAVDRIGDNIPITARAGWYISIANTAGSGVVYSETIGTVALTGGELLVVFNNDMNGGSGNSQTLTLNGLTHAGSSNTASVVFGRFITFAVIPDGV